MNTRTPPDDSSELLRRLRDEHGLSQDHIAAATGASVRSIRNWEQGMRPRPTFARRLLALEQLLLALPAGVRASALFTVDPKSNRCPAELVAEGRFEDALAAAAHSAPSHDMGQLTEPQVAGTAPRRALRQDLPLSSLSWSKFERFCKQLLEYENPQARVHHYGTSGSKQRGIDIVVDFDDGRRYTYQCKLVKRCDAATVRAAIKAHAFEGSHHYLLIGARAQTGARDEIERHADWDILDDLDISDRVRALTPGAARALLDAHFGQAIRREFLGSAGVGTFLPATELLQPLLDHDRIFHHGHPLVGREAVLQELMSLTSSIEPRAILLPGTGGVGKTRLLLEFDRRWQHEHPDEQVLWLATDAPLTPDALDELPPEPVVVIVDDAHRRLNIGELLKIALRRRWPITLILAVRPQGRRPLALELTADGWDPSWIVELDELPALDDSAAADLACQWSSLDPRAAEAWAQASGGVPLILTLGAELLTRGGFDPSRPTSHQAFRKVVLARWKDEMLGRVGDEDASQVRELLSILAAIGPISDRNDEVLGRLATWLEADGHLAELLASLEESGILVRHGSLLRVTPDVLADEVFASAALSSTGQDTGFVRRLYDKFGDIHLAPLLRSAAELDWRLRVQNNQVDLVGQIWSLLQDEFRSAGAGRRVALVAGIANAAVYEPRRVLDLVRWSIDHTAVSEARGEYVPPVTQDDVRHALPTLLRRVALHLEHLPEALDLLWKLAETDVRPTNQFSDHPWRVIEDIASYEGGKPLEVQSAVLHSVERWLSTGNRALTPNGTPLAVLRPLLAKSGYSMSSRAFAISFEPFFVDATNTKTLRARAVDLAFGALESEDLRVGADAVGLLEEALREPIGYFGADPSTEIVDQWRGDQLELLDRLHDHAPRCAPALVPRMRQAVWWHARYNEERFLNESARSVIDALPDTARTRLAVAVSSGWPHDYDDQDEDGDPAESRWQRHQRRVETRLTTVAEDLLAGGQSAEAIVTLLRDAVTAATLIGEKPGSAEAVLRQIVQHDPDRGLEVLERVIADDGPLASDLAQALAVAWNVDRDVTMRLALQILYTGEEQALRSLASAWSWGPWAMAEQADPEALLVLGSLLECTVPGVAEVAVRALEALWEIDRPKAVALIVTAAQHADPGMANELCAILVNPPDRMASLSDVDLEQLMGMLQRLPSLDPHWIRKCLTLLGSLQPVRTVEALLDRLHRGRLRRASEKADKYFDPLPFDFDTPGQLGDDISPSERSAFLRLIRDRAVDADGQAVYWLPRLFAGVCDNWGPIALSALDEFITSGDSTLLVTASLLLRHAPNGFVFDNQPFVTRLLETAERLGSGTLERVQGDLGVSVISGGGTRTPGEPDPRMMRIRDRATQAAGNSTSPYARRFYGDLVNYATRSIEEDLRRDAEVLGWQSPVR